MGLCGNLSHGEINEYQDSFVVTLTVKSDVKLILNPFIHQYDNILADRITVKVNGNECILSWKALVQF